MLWKDSRRKPLFGFTLGLAAACAVGAAERPEATADHPVAKTIKLASGVQLQYVAQGYNDGIPVILLHGYSDSWHSWDRLLPMLPQQLRVYAYSQRGHGVSDRPDSGYTFKDLSNDLAQFMDAMGVQSAVLVGHSMSSGVVRQFALDYPERVRGLVLEAGFATWKGNPVLEAFWNETISKLEDPIDRSFAEEFQRSTLKRPVPPEFFNMVVGESLKLPARVWKDVFRNFMELDFSADTRTITAPTIIIWGDQDTFADLAEQQKLQAAIPGSRLITYAGTGHGMHWEEPEKFARDLINFAKSVK